MFIVWSVICGVMFVVGVITAIAGTNYDDGSILTFFVGMFLLIGGISGFVVNLNLYNHAKHVQAYQDLTRAGWNIHDYDVKILDNNVRIDCAMFKIKKIGDTYRVVRERPDQVGGGYIILDPSIQRKLRDACTSTTSSS